MSVPAPDTTRAPFRAWTRPFRDFVVRSNRSLATYLHEQDMLDLGNLDKVMDLFMDNVSNSDLRRATMLGLLIGHLNAIDEDDYIAHQVEQDKLGVIDLRLLESADTPLNGQSIDHCWATWSIPFDHEDGIWSVATAYFHSAPVREYWEKHLNGKVLWYATTMDSISDLLNRVSPPENGETTG